MAKAYNMSLFALFLTTRTRGALVLAALAVMAPSGTGQRQFDELPKQHLPQDSGDTVPMAFGDVDGDGDPDLVLANQGQANRVHANNGSGIFTRR